MTHDFATLSCNVYHIHQAEEAAKQTTAHQCRIQGWAEGTTLEMQAQKIKEWIESKLPACPMPTIQQKAYAAVLFFPDRQTAAKFATQFIEDEPTLNDKPFYTKPQLPPSVIASQRPLVNARHVLATEKESRKNIV